MPWRIRIYRKQETGAGSGAEGDGGTLGAGVLALVMVHAEVYGWLRNDFDAYAAGCGDGMVGAGGDGVFMVGRVRSAPHRRRGLGGWRPWRWRWRWCWGWRRMARMWGRGICYWPTPRFGACLLVVAAILGEAWAIHRAGKSEAGDARRVFAIDFLNGGLAAFLAVLLAPEVYTFCVDVIGDVAGARRAGQMWITLVWSVYAAGLLWAGFWRRWRWVRWGGLGLFGVAALKLVLVDLTFLKDVYRIVAFLVLGVLMLAA